MYLDQHDYRVLAGRDSDFPFAGYLLSILPTPQQALTQTAALQDFAPANDRLGVKLSRPGDVRCTLFPRKRKSIRDLAMSHSCQFRTHAVQQTETLFDYFIDLRE
jgi:hypothetical protein